MSGGQGRAGTHGIGAVSRRTGFSADTLRYYERIGLLPRVRRAASGARIYDEADLSRLRFIQRARAMGFSLDEIARLLEMREHPRQARDEVRALARRKLDEVERRIETLAALRRELASLIGLCRGAGSGCPIIDGLEDPGQD